jgi:hypothetical protein
MQEPLGTRVPRSRAEMLASMRRTTDAFYRAAIVSGVHAFIEFCGLMNEFIEVCRDADADGVAFENANVHSTSVLPLRAIRAAYLAEKLKCIYGPSLAADEEARTTFIDVLFDRKYKLSPAVETGAEHGCRISV